jgi:predicted Na+-dependent transporter
VGGQVVTGASISAWDIVRSLLLLVLLPLLAGLFARARYTEHAKHRARQTPSTPNTEHAKTWQPELVEVANLAMVVALATGIAASWSTIVSMFGSWVIVTAIIIVLVAGSWACCPALMLRWSTSSFPSPWPWGSVIEPERRSRRRSLLPGARRAWKQNATKRTCSCSAPFG